VQSAAAPSVASFEDRSALGFRARRPAAIVTARLATQDGALRVLVPRNIQRFFS